MFTSLKLPESPSVRRRFSDSTLDSYSNFRNHLLSEEETSDNFPPNNIQDARQLLPIDLKLQKPLNRLLSDVQVIERSRKTKKENTVKNVKNTRVTRSTSRNKENTPPDLSKNLDVPAKRTKRKLFDTESLSKPDTKKRKIAVDESSVINQTNKSLLGLSDTAVSIFLQNLDQEIAHESGDLPLKSLVSDSAELPTPNLPEAEYCNQICYKKLPKRKSADKSQKTVSHSTKKDYDIEDSVKDKDFKIDKSASTSYESSSSIAASTSRYGRVRKTPPVYINATIFKGNLRKSAEVKQKAATLINSHNCKSKLKMCKLDDAHDTCPPEEVIFKKPLDKNEFNGSTCSSQNDETSKSQKIIIHQNVLLRSPDAEKKPVEYVKPSIHDLRQNTSLSRTPQSSISQVTFQTSNDDLEDLFDDRGRRPDPNEIHAVVNDEVVSFKWYASTPDLDSVLSDESVHYSMSDLKSFYTNVKVGYLKIDAGHRKSMKVLRDSIMLYFVERGEAMFRVSEREIAGQIGSTFFIPLGVEYTITNLKTEDLILKFVKMSPSASVL